MPGVHVAYGGGGTTVPGGIGEFGGVNGVGPGGEGKLRAASPPAARAAALPATGEWRGPVGG